VSDCSVILAGTSGPAVGIVGSSVTRSRVEVSGGTVTGISTKSATSCQVEGMGLSGRLIVVNAGLVQGCRVTNLGASLIGVEVVGMGCLVADCSIRAKVGVLIADGSEAAATMLVRDSAIRFKGGATDPGAAFTLDGTTEFTPAAANDVGNVKSSY
jgi:hypothetical protein